jgi:hypothetical protein
VDPKNFFKNFNRTKRVSRHFSNQTKQDEIKEYRTEEDGCKGSADAKSQVMGATSSTASPIKDSKLKQNTNNGSLVDKPFTQSPAHQTSRYQPLICSASQASPAKRLDRSAQYERGVPRSNHPLQITITPAVRRGKSLFILATRQPSRAPRTDPKAIPTVEIQVCTYPLYQNIICVAAAPGPSCALAWTVIIHRQV